MGDGLVLGKEALVLYSRWPGLCKSKHTLRLPGRPFKVEVRLVSCEEVMVL